jgi:hypothetical protein
MDSRADPSATRGSLIRRSAVGALTTLLSTFPSTAISQDVRSVRMSPPDATLAEEFTTISSVRELGNGQVLITDRREQRAVLADFRTGQVSPVAGRGQGPGEYSSPPQVFPLRGDSSLLVARTQRRWILMHGARIASTLPPDAQPLLQTQGLVLGTDTLGRVLSTRMPAPRPGVTQVSARDSLELVLVERGSGRSDTIARLRRMASTSKLEVDAQGREKSVSYDRPGVMPTEEIATIFADGAVAIARLNPFRVEWRLPNGSWIRGDSVPIRPVRLDARQKQWYMKTIAGGGAPQRPETVSGWPETIPPFLSTVFPLVAASDGRLLVRRTRDAAHPDTRYLIINRQGLLEAEIALPARQSIVGFGRRHVYVIATDADGVQRLQRHPWAN